MQNFYRITKKEKETIEKNGYKFTKLMPYNQEINSILMVVHNPSNRHETGYCYICVFGVLDTKELIDMGWHDVVEFNIPVRTDSFGKNIFRIFKHGLNYPVWKCGRTCHVSDTLKLLEEGFWF